MTRRLAVACLLLFASAAQSQTIVLIGGIASEGPGRHDYPRGIRALQAMIAASPDMRDLGVAAYPDGWPDDPHAFDDASTVLLYFDGLDKHPLRDPQRRAALDAAAKRGVGLVALHQASTVLPGEDFGLPRLLGATRRGMFDRTTEWAQLAPAALHAVTRGIGSIEVRDEFYPTFVPYSFEHPTLPILTATLHPQFRDGHALLEDTPEQTTVAWAYEREDGGRSFVYTGAHFLAALDAPGVRTLLMNAVRWTAKRDVPVDGVRVAASSTVAAPSAVANVPPRPARATFHIDAQRSGWRSKERVLTPKSVADPTFGQV